MLKIKKYLIRIFGSLVAFLFSIFSNSLNLKAMDDLMYGVGMHRNINNNETLVEKTNSTLLLPLIAIIVTVLAFSVGIVIYFLRKGRKKKNVKKNT